MHEIVSRRLTEEVFFAGLRCPKLAWKMVRGQMPKEELSATSVVEEEVHRLARGLFKGGKFAKDLEDYYLYVSQETRIPIFDASVSIASHIDAQWELYCCPDVLICHDGSWEIHGFEGASNITEESIWNIAYQSYVIGCADLPFHKCFLWHLNPAYVRGNAVDLKKIFIRNDVTLQVKRTAKTIERELKRLVHILNIQTTPPMPVGSYCLQHPNMDSCVECPLKVQCWAHFPDKNNFSQMLHRFTRKKSLKSSSYLGKKKGI